MCWVLKFRRVIISYNYIGSFSLEMRIQEWLGVQSLQEANKAKGKGIVYNLAEIAYKEQLLLQAPN